MIGRERNAVSRGSPGGGHAKLTRVASGKARQMSRRAAASVAPLVSSPTRVIVPPIRNCSCVTGKYQQSSARDNPPARPSCGREVGHKGEQMRLVQEPPKYDRAICRAAVGAHRGQLHESRIGASGFDTTPGPARVAIGCAAFDYSGCCMTPAKDQHAALEPELRQSEPEGEA